MKPISEAKWWRVAKSGYNPPKVTAYFTKNIIVFRESVYSGDFVYSRITKLGTQYCVRAHKDEWRTKPCV